MGPTWLLALCLLAATAADSARPELVAPAAQQPRRPRHIVFIVADDLGFADLGARGQQIRTPALDGLLRDGVELLSYYVLPDCSPTRAAIMTGRYPMRYGVNVPLDNFFAHGVSRNETFLPEALASRGYRTHAVGKWHLGFYDWQLTPTFRGFESFYGFYSGGEDYYMHVMNQVFPGFDMRRETRSQCGPSCSRLDYTAFGRYSTELFAAEAERVIGTHNASEPLFLYVAFQAVHAPDEAPDAYVRPYKRSIRTAKRRIYAGMLSALDEAVGNITRRLASAGMWEDTLLVFTTDNGGPSETCAVQGSSNWPLRGGKCTVWEGGTRGMAFVHGAGLPRGAAYDGLVHAVDWLPTLAGNSGPLPLDGVDQWAALTGVGDAPRKELFYGYSILGGTATRRGRWKLVMGDPGPGGWLSPANLSHAVVEELAPRSGTKYLQIPALQGPVRLYDIEADPEEHNDLARVRPDIVASLRRGLETYNQEARIHQADAYNASCGPPVPAAGPMPAWSPWCSSTSPETLLV